MPRALARCTALRQLELTYADRLELYDDDMEVFEQLGNLEYLVSAGQLLCLVAWTIGACSGSRPVGWVWQPGRWSGSRQMGECVHARLPALHHRRL